MNSDQIMEQVFTLLVKQEGLDGKLDKNEIVALFGICEREISKELGIAAEFLRGSPSKEAVADFYKSERAGNAAAAVDTSSSIVDIGKLRGISFTPAMWEVVKGCRLAGHFSKLDALSNYFVSKWGNLIDGNFSIDAHVNKNPENDYVDYIRSMLDTSIDAANSIMTLENKEISNEKIIYRKKLIFFEFVYFLLHLTDRFVFGRLDEQSRAEIMTEIEDLALYAAIDRVFKNQPENILEENTQKIFNDFEESSSFCSQYKNLLNTNNKSPAGTLYWEFGKRIAELSDHKENALYIMTTVQIVHEYMMTKEILNFVDKLTEINA